MATVLICVLPAQGHTGPALPAAAALVRTRHRYAETFAGIGAHPAVLPRESDFAGKDAPAREGLRGRAAG